MPVKSEVNKEETRAFWGYVAGGALMVLSLAGMFGGHPEFLVGSIPAVLALRYGHSHDRVAKQLFQNRQ